MIDPLEHEPETRLGFAFAILGFIEGISLFVITVDGYVSIYTGAVSGTLMSLTAGPFIVASWILWAIIIVSVALISGKIGDVIARLIP